MGVSRSGIDRFSFSLHGALRGRRLEGSAVCLVFCCAARLFLIRADLFCSARHTAEGKAGEAGDMNAVALVVPPCTILRKKTILLRFVDGDIVVHGPRDFSFELCQLPIVSGKEGFAFLPAVVRRYSATAQAIEIPS